MLIVWLFRLSLFSSPGVHAWGRLAQRRIPSPFKGLPHIIVIRSRPQRKPLKGLIQRTAARAVPGVNAWARENAYAVIDYFRRARPKFFVRRGSPDPAVSATEGFL